MKDQKKAIVAGVLLLVAAVLLTRWVFGEHGNARLWDSDKADERLLAVEALRADDSGAARERLTRMLSDSDRRVVVQSVRAMAFNRSESSHRVLVEQLRTAADPQVRGEVAAALGRYEQTPTKTLTSLLASDPEPKVRAGAARGLAAKKDKAAVPELYKALSDPDPQVRAWAITGIGRATLHRFIYEAERSPEQQQQRIRDIGELLRRSGHL
jgi:HEAT repeat protein